MQDLAPTALWEYLLTASCNVSSKEDPFFLSLSHHCKTLNHHRDSHCVKKHEMNMNGFGESRVGSHYAQVEYLSTDG
jgi:hypothetical protein